MKVCNARVSRGGLESWRAFNTGSGEQGSHSRYVSWGDVPRQGAPVVSPGAPALRETSPACTPLPACLLLVTW